MRQDTKNFSDITVINTADQLVINVDLTEHEGAVYNFTVNDIPLLSNTGTFYSDLLSSVKFNCVVQTGAVEIAKITINKKEVMPIYLNQADPKTNWITDNWTLTVPGPFYTWYHQITGQGWIA